MDIRPQSGFPFSFRRMEPSHVHVGLLFDFEGFFQLWSIPIDYTDFLDSLD